MKIENLDTPSLLIDREIMRDNMTFMLNYAARRGVKLRPHTKTHKMAAVARLQVEMGASGIAVAKVGEAEAMADAGLDDIFIANEIVGAQKWERIRALAQRGVKVSFGIDSPEVLPGIQNVFAGAASPAEVMVEIEVGERRSVSVLRCGLKGSFHTTATVIAPKTARNWSASPSARRSARCVSPASPRRPACPAKP